MIKYEYLTGLETVGGKCNVTLERYSDRSETTSFARGFFAFRNASL